METYSKFRPTQFDRHISIDSKEHWLVLPTGRNRDSDVLNESNFEVALQMLGGESDTVEVHRFGHWANGWFEIIIVDPESPQAKIAEDIERSLEDYPVLDEDNYLEKESEEQYENWKNYLEREFCSSLESIFEICLDHADEQSIWDYFIQLQDLSNTEWENGWIDIDRITDKAELSSLLLTVQHVQIDKALFDSLPHALFHSLMKENIAVYDLDDTLLSVPDFIAVQHNVNQLTIGDILK